LGLALIAHGAAGYAMGFKKLDSLAAATFEENGGGPGQANRYYFHNLLLPALTGKADDIANVQATSPAYPCRCTHCQGRLPTKISSKERTYHYIDRRLAELAALHGLNRAQTQTHLKNLFNQAYNLSLATHSELSKKQTFSKNALKPDEFAHLDVIAQCL
jgi:hypothetical protein